MRLLLIGINSKFIHSNPAVYSLKAYACEYASCVSISEYTINQQVEEIMASICRQKPDYIAISCYIWNRNVVSHILKDLPKVLPNTKIFLGGPEVSYNPEQVLNEFPCVSAVLIGEGEVTFKELLSVLPDNPALLNEEILDNIAGLYTQNGYSSYRGLTDINTLPFIYEKEDLLTPESSFANRIIYYESSRGCPYNCSYCLSSIDKTLRLRNIEDVKSHLDIFLRSKVPQVKFIDRTFNANSKHSSQIFKYLLENDNNVTNFHFEIAAEILTDEEISMLNSMRPGLVQLEIGVQTMNPITLKEINRHCDFARLKDVVSALISPGNVHIHLDLIAGLPYEDYDSFINSFNEVYNMHPHQLQLGFLKVLKGTQMDSKSDEYGLEYSELPPYEVLKTKWISYDELLNLKDVCAVLEDYYNSSQFTQTLPHLISCFNTPYEFYYELSQYYRKHNYFVKSPARSKKYDILLEFASSIKGLAFAEEIRTYLTYDYYLRENPKRKPDFVKTVPDIKQFDYTHKNPLTNNAYLIKDI